MAKKSTKTPKLVIESLYEKKKAKLKGEYSLRDLAVDMESPNPQFARTNMALMFKPNYNPSFKMMIRIAKALDCKVSDLFEE